MTATPTPTRVAAMRQRRKNAGLVRIDRWVPAAIRADVIAVIKAMIAAALEKPDNPG